MHEDRPRLDQINLVTGDVAATVEFFRLLGLNIPDSSAPGWSSHHLSDAVDGAEGALTFDIDSTAFAACWGSEAIPAGPALSFRVASRQTVDRLYERLCSAGHRGLRAPYDAFWGARFALVEAPGGAAVGLMSESSDQHRSEPPALAGLE